MSPTFLATVRNALVSFSTSANPSLQFGAFRPLKTTRSFHALRSTTDLSELRKRGPQALCPPYPYGPRQTFKEADNGLYGSAQLQSGNKISQGRNKGKTRRRWHPNVRIETIRSEALDRTMTIPITASCMRTIRKCGGLDQYLLGDKPARIKELGIFGWRLRWLVLNSDIMHQQYEKERKNLGLPPRRSRLETFEEAWKSDEKLRDEVQKEQETRWQELREKDERFRKHVKSRWAPKDKKNYIAPRVVPGFDEVAFEALKPDKYA